MFSDIKLKLDLFNPKALDVYGKVVAIEFNYRLHEINNNINPKNCKFVECFLDPLSNKLCVVIGYKSDYLITFKKDIKIRSSQRYNKSNVVLCLHQIGQPQKCSEEMVIALEEICFLEGICIELPTSFLLKRTD